MHGTTHTTKQARAHTHTNTHIYIQTHINTHTHIHTNTLNISMIRFADEYKIKARKTYSLTINFIIRQCIIINNDNLTILISNSKLTTNH